MLKAGVKQILFSFGCAAYGAPATVPIRENQPKLLALRHLLSGGASAELNLGTGRGHSVKEVVSAVERTSGQRIVTRTADRRPGDPPQLVADPSNAASVLGWKPHYPRLHSIVESAWRWHAAQAGVQVQGGVDIYGRVTSQPCR